MVVAVCTLAAFLPHCSGGESGSDVAAKADTADGIVAADTVVPWQTEAVDAPDVSDVPDVPDADACVPECEDRVCGSDGCGGTCGDCAEGHVCLADGSCLCLPECTEKQCGDDGCQGTCGTCASEQFCNAGACEATCASDQGCDEAGTKKCTASGEAFVVCEETELACFKWGAAISCDGTDQCIDGECVPQCIPQCDGKDCGGDGCDDVCGVCGEEEFCNDGSCSSVCVSDTDCTEAGLTKCAEAASEAYLECEEVEAGCFQWSDPIACELDYECETGACVYQPWCGDGSCDIALNEDCGTCGADCGCGCGEACQAGTCVFAACDGRACGPDGCSGSCGDCPEHYECQADGSCMCLPLCDDKDCGADGCGGQCGTCDTANHEICTADVCTCDGDAGYHLSADGQTCTTDLCDPDPCDADANETCDDGNCGCAWESCGNDGTVCCGIAEVCFEDSCCAPDCAGKDCGADGCGGACGDCGENGLCANGACEIDKDQDGVPTPTDCDDDDPSVHPNADEIPYDAKDNDCDEATSDTDFDGDGYDSMILGGTDCNDANANAYPSAPEFCGDWIDQDCDGHDLVCPSGQTCDHETGQCEPDPTCGGCPPGQQCNAETGQCESDPTCGGGCPAGQVCHEESGVCFVDTGCGLGCPPGKSCNPDTGLCYVDVTCGGCPQGQVCNITSGLCEIKGDCGGCLMNEICNSFTGLCDPNPVCGDDFCVKPEGMVKVGDVYVDKYEASQCEDDESKACSIPGAEPWTSVWIKTARDACRKAHKRLCSVETLQSACDGVVGEGGSIFPYGNQYQPAACNTEVGATSTTGSQPYCQNQAYEVFDTVGNVAEWGVLETCEEVLGCVTEIPYAFEYGDPTSWAAVGGHYESGALANCNHEADADPLGFGGPTIGFRCCIAPSDDLDNDGFTAAEECDDTNADVNPDADEICNGLDDDCNGVTDDTVDLDGDGYNECEDCNDVFASYHPGAEDMLGDGKDQNCDGVDGTDEDGDGYLSQESGGLDCNDASASFHPGAGDTVGDGKDQNCDGLDGVDADGDGHASEASGGDDCSDQNPEDVVADCEGKECGGGSGECSCGACEGGLVCEAGGICGTVSQGFVGVPAGSFWMGSPNSEYCSWELPGYSGGGCLLALFADVELGRGADETLHYVELTKPFEIQAKEVTQGEWKAVYPEWNPSYFSGCGDGCPVEQVSWYDVLAYSNAKSAAAGLAACYVLTGIACEDGTSAAAPADCMTSTRGGINVATVTLSGEMETTYECTGYRLPTESEWEYAYRAGETTAFHTSAGNDGAITQTGREPLDPNLDQIGWYGGNSPATYVGADIDCTGWFTNSTTCGPQPGGGKEANAWGLYDMSGNVWEWCWDWYASTYPAGTVASPAQDPTVESGFDRVKRGGSWYDSAGATRAASRVDRAPGHRSFSLGARLARTIVPPAPKPAIAGNYDIDTILNHGNLQPYEPYLLAIRDLYNKPATSIMLLTCVLSGSPSDLCDYIFLDPQNPSANELTTTGNVMLAVLEAALGSSGEYEGIGDDVFDVFDSLRLLASFDLQSEPNENGVLFEFQTAASWHTASYRWTRGSGCMQLDTSCGWRNFALASAGQPIHETHFVAILFEQAAKWALAISEQVLPLDVGKVIDYTIQKHISPRVFGDGSDGLPVIDSYEKYLKMIMGGGKQCLTGSGGQSCCDNFASSMSSQPWMIPMMTSACETIATLGAEYYVGLLSAYGTSEQMRLATKTGQPCDLYDLDGDQTIDAWGMSEPASEHCVWEVLMPMGGTDYYSESSFHGSRNP